MGSYTLRGQQNGFALSEIVIAAAACLIVVLVGLALHRRFHHTSAGAQHSATASAAAPANNHNTNEYATLAPATVPSKTPECSHKLTFSSNGNSGPVTCANGDLNTAEWTSLAALEPTVLTLGYTATAVQVQAALCADVRANVSNATEGTAYQIASLYYGWQFAANPGTVLTNGTCVNTDD
ncbi:MAG TPA: hypothetical protein VF261_02810 [Candidatus Saccharimonadales bacterium]